ncbi:hypothetical protein [uncultured Nostoc sp.]|uniref:hypothetical protein n=1 Tax=uncultured Nostoc sp. TaxID=340711 RepID=UPI0035CAC036
MKVDQRAIASSSKCNRLSNRESQRTKAIAPSMKVDERAIASFSNCDRLSDCESQTIKAIAPSMKVDERASVLLFASST